jgi:hypothetical protein
MSFAFQETQQRFPFSCEDVFDGLIYVLPTIDLTVKEADKVIGRISASTGMSLFSWGENIALVVESIDESSCRIGLQSSLKVGANIGGAHRHQKNFDRIISALSKFLQSPHALLEARNVYADEAGVLIEYGIQKLSGYYRLDGYDYDRLQDAVSHAKSLRIK